MPETDPVDDLQPLQMPGMLRKPQRVLVRDEECTRILAGIIAQPEDEFVVTDDSDIIATLAVRLRRWHNMHQCTRKLPGDPECKNPWHARDVALLRDMMAKLGVPGDPGLIETGKAVIAAREMEGST